MLYTESSFTGMPVGIGLALESMLVPNAPRIDPERVPPPPVILLQAGVLIINVYTLIDSIVSAANTELDAQTVTGIALNVTAKLETTVRLGGCQGFYVYNIDYGNVLKKLKLEDSIVNLKEDTKKYKLLQLVNKSVASYIKLAKVTPLGDILRKHANTRFLVMTHHLIDMVLMPEQLTVLFERHTGRSRTANMLYERLAKVGKEPAPNVKVNATTLRIFGDGKVIRPAPIALRRELIDLIKRAVNIKGVLTETQVRRLINSKGSQPLKNLLK